MIVELTNYSAVTDVGKREINDQQVNEALVDEDVEAGIVETQSTSVIA